MKNIAVLITFIFGFILLIFVMGPGDGGWILLGDQLLNDKKIYSELGLNQQPIFPIYSSFIFFLSGKNIVINKLLYLPIVIFFVYVINRLSSVNNKNILFRNIFILAIFFCSITFEAFRFEDYHALTYCLVLLSIFFTLNYFIGLEKFDSFILKQAFICALTFFTRINEGISLYISFIIVFVLCLNQFSIKVLLKVLLIFVLTFILILFLQLFYLDENPSDWLLNTILHASSAKGGSNQLLKSPLNLFLNSYKFIYNSFSLTIFFTVITWYILNKYLTNFYLSIISSILFILLLLYLFSVNIIISLTSFSVILSLLFFLYGFFSKFLLNKNWEFILFIYPLSLFILGSLSSAGTFVGLFFPLSVFLIIFDYVFFKNISTIEISKKTFYYSFYSLLVIIFLNSMIIRVNNPYSWHSYYSPSNPFSYSLTRDKSFGYFAAPKELMSLIDPVCDIVSKEDSLFSTPYSYANYYCDISPWNGYVQSFFDTSTQVLISDIIRKLSKSPPNFIFFQRQELNLLAHENTFNGGRPLPHRALDEYIMQRVSNGDWTIVYSSNAYPPSEWLLINTNLVKYDH